MKEGFLNNNAGKNTRESGEGSRDNGMKETVTELLKKEQSAAETRSGGIAHKIIRSMARRKRLFILGTIWATTLSADISVRKPEFDTAAPSPFAVMENGTFANQIFPLGMSPGDAILNDIRVEYTREAARHPVSAEEYFAERVASEDPKVRRTAVRRETPPEILAKLADDEDSTVRFLLVRHVTSPELLAKLADDLAFSVRREVVKNKFTTEETLIKLAKDEDPSIRREVALRTLSPELLTAFADDEHPSVREAAAKKETPLPVLIKLADDKEIQVREAVARCPVPLETHMKLARDRYESVREIVARYTPFPEVLTMLSNEKDRGEYTEDGYDRNSVWYADVRAAVAGNDHTPTEVLIKLANDKHEYVRRAARQNLERKNHRMDSTPAHP